MSRAGNKLDGFEIGNIQELDFDMAVHCLSSLIIKVSITYRTTSFKNENYMLRTTKSKKNVIINKCSIIRPLLIF